MKLLFTADLHIKLGQKNVPETWAKDRYKLLFSEIHKLCDEKQVDKLVVGGDIFDRLPNMEELELYFEFISRLIAPTILYSGNHEALKKSTTFLTSLKNVTTKLNKYAVVIDDYVSLDGIDYIPYNKLKEWSENPDNTFVSLHNRILCTHVRGAIPPHVLPEVPLELFDRWKLVLAGDLHSYTNSQRNILYPGSPLTTTFHRTNVDTGVIILDTESLGHEWVKLNIPQLIRKTIKAGEPMPQTDFDHTIYEVEGDMLELSMVEHNDLLDKKLVKREIDTALILDSSMSLDKEVEEYLRYILQLNDRDISNILHELSVHI